MAYTNLSKVFPGQKFAEADLDVIRDNFAENVPDRATAKGEIYAAADADTGVNVAVGTTGYWFGGNSSATAGVAWKTFGTAVARYEINTALTITTSPVMTIVDYDNSVYDPDNAVTTGASWKYTVPDGKDGYYFVTATISLVASTTWDNGELAMLWVYKNGSSYSQMTGSQHPGGAGAGHPLFMNGAEILYLSAADYINIGFYNGSSAVQTSDTNPDYSYVSITKVF